MRPFRFLGLALLPLAVALAASPLPGDQPTSVVALTRGDYSARFYAVTTGMPPHGLVVFGSGDGGWSYWEERMGKHLAARGFAVVGIDFKNYAVTGYTPAILRRDYLSLVAELRRRTPDSAALPLFYGGWSMGAEQAVPAAADHALRPVGLRGFLLVAPGARGRYGLHLRDRMGIAPSGSDTFSLHELAAKSTDLRFAVFHGGLDPMDDLGWSDGLGLTYKRWVIPRVFHDFAGAGDDFLAEVDGALLWLLEKPAPPTPAAPAK